LTHLTKDPPNDGHCLYGAVAISVFGCADYRLLVRLLTSLYGIVHQNHYIGMVICFKFLLNLLNWSLKFSVGYTGVTHLYCSGPQINAPLSANLSMLCDYLLHYCSFGSEDVHLVHGMGLH